MLSIEVGPDDLAASRFGIGPLTELERLIRRLGRGRLRSGPGTSGVPARWAARSREIRDSLEVRVVHALQPATWGPDFLSPPPAGIVRTVADDLAAVRATPPALARRQIAQARADVGPADADVEAFLAGRRVVARLADALEQLWTTLIAPDWPQLLAILERDVLHRAEALTRGGWEAALSDLHPSLRWDEGTVRVLRSPERAVRLDGRGLMFVPSVFMHPGLATSLDPPWQPAIVYPARGSAALWDQRPPAPPAALARLLGRARADLLLHLDTPASTTQLARLTGQGIGAVGDHLRILLDAGFVARGRVGRSVLYRRTPVADAVLAGH